jgi:hypothetical protein
MNTILCVKRRYHKERFSVSDDNAEPRSVHARIVVKAGICVNKHYRLSEKTIRMLWPQLPTRGARDLPYALFQKTISCDRERSVIDIVA